MKTICMATGTLVCAGWLVGCATDGSAPGDNRDLARGMAPAAVEAAAGTALVYGINHDDFNAFNCAIPHGIHGYRVYRDAVIMTAADVNTQWPDDLASNYSTLSLRPDPMALLSGSLDAAINALMDTAPDHAELTIWHEAGPGNPLHYPASVTAASLRAMHAHMQALVTAHGHVKYGQIITGPAAGMIDWLGRGLDWYGVDIYDNPNFQNANGTLDQSKITTRMDQNKAAFASVSSGTPSLRITETNSSHDGHRKNWLLFLSEWMVANNGFRLLMFFHADGPLSGPWPPSQGVIDFFNSTLIPEFGRDPTFVNPCVQ